MLRIKIWGADGTIVYSDKNALIGTSYDLGEEERDILANGGIEAEVSDLDRPENRFERSSSGVVEVYTSIESPEGIPLLFEAYFSAADLDARKQQVFQPFYRITLGGLAILLGVATPMLWVLTRRLTRAANERERLLRTAVDASSDNERRRIARDLHDGVVQDLAGTAFAVGALARLGDRPDPPGGAGAHRGVAARHPPVAPVAAGRDPPAGPAGRRARRGPGRPDRAGLRRRDPGHASR